MHVVSNIPVDLLWVLQDLVFSHPKLRPIGKAADLLILLHPACDPDPFQLVPYEVGSLCQVVVVPAKETLLGSPGTLCVKQSNCC